MTESGEEGHVKFMPLPEFQAIWDRADKGTTITYARIKGTLCAARKRYPKLDILAGHVWPLGCPRDVQLHVSEKASGQIKYGAGQGVLTQRKAPDGWTHYRIAKK